MTLDALESGGAAAEEDGGNGRSPSKGGPKVDESAAVDGVGALTFARDFNTVGGYVGVLNVPFALPTFDAADTGAWDAMGALG